MSNALTQEEKTRLRQLYLVHQNINEVSRLTGINHKTVSRHVHDLKSEPDYGWVIEARRAAKTDPSFSAAAYGKAHGYSETTIRQAVTGQRFKQVDSVESPAVIREAMLDRKAQSRALYEKGESFNAICRKLGVPKSSLSGWCKDLIQQRLAGNGGKRPATKGVKKENILKWEEARRIRLEEHKSYKVIALRVGVSEESIRDWCRDILLPAGKRKRESVKRGHMTPEQVAEARRCANETKNKNLAFYAGQHNVSIHYVNQAITGKTFAEVNDIEPPFTYRRKRTYKPNKRNRVHQIFLPEMVDMIQTSDKVWTLSELGKWMSGKTGKSYRPTHIKTLLSKNYPDLLSSPKVTVSSPSPRKVLPKKYRVLTPQQVRAKAENAKKRRELERAANRYEAWANAGFPDNWGTPV